MLAAALAIAALAPRIGGAADSAPAPELLAAKSAAEREREEEERRVLGADKTVRATTDPPRLPFARWAIDRPRLRVASTVSLARIVEALPGVRAATGNDPLGDVVVRGSGGSRVRLLDHGVPVASFELPGLDGPGIDLSGADRVTVTPGADASFGGEGAIGATLDIESAAPIAVDRPRVSNDGAFYGSSADRGAGAVVRAAGARDVWDAEVSLVARRARGVTTPAGRIDPIEGDVFQGAAGVRVTTPKTHAGLRLVRFGGPFDRPVVGAPALSRELEDRRVQWSGGMATGGVDFEMRGQIQQRTLDVRARNGAGAPLEMRLEGTHLEFSGRHDGPRGSGMLGVAGLAQNTETRGGRRIVPDARVIAGAVYGAGRLVRGAWTAVGNARLDTRNLEAEHDPTIAIPTLQRSFDAITGGVGVDCRAREPLVLSLALGSGWRMPSLLELYANGRSPVDDHYRLGDRRLDLERGVTLDAGARWTGRRVNGELRLFRQWIDRWVGLEATGEVIDGLSVRRTVAHDANLLGAEAALACEVTDRLRLLAGLDVASGEDATADRPLSGVPPARFRLAAETHGAPIAGLGDARLRLGVEGHGRGTRPGVDEVVIDPFVLVDLEAEQEWNGMRLGVRVDNLTDVRAREFLARDAALATRRGRGVVVSIGWER